jgi:redox-sensitive bicupin YhaK (pirin superfamily)
MQIQIRRAVDRGQADHGWLRSAHTFSFADYHDPRHMGFGPLRVINEDRVAPGRGFGAHSHRDMEILSYVLDGELAHQDSMGTGSVIRPGDVQRMTAGRGVTHSEANPSRDREVHFLQIWITPSVRGLAPGYEQRAFPEAERRGRLRLLASPDGADGSLTIHQDARLYGAVLAGADAVRHELAPGRRAWVHVARGAIKVGGAALTAGDAAAIAEPGAIELAGDGEVLLFDLP